MCCDTYSARGTARRAVSKLVVAGKPRDHPAKTVDLRREMFRYLRLKEFEIVRKIQFNARKSDRRTVLLREAEFVPGHTQMAYDARERTDFRAFRNIVRHCVQTDVVIPTAAAIERIQTADHAVLFQDAHVAFVLRQADSSR